MHTWNGDSDGALILMKINSGGKGRPGKTTRKRNAVARALKFNDNPFGDVINAFDENAVFVRVENYRLNGWNEGGKHEKY